MTILFYSLAMLMIIIALVIILVPLLRSGSRHGKPRSVLVVAIVLIFALPLSAVGIYATVGDPYAAIFAGQQQNAAKMTLQEAVTKLKQRLKAAPDNLQGWLLLGQTLDAMQRPAEARDAYASALKLDPANPNILVAWVQADSMARPDHRITAKARAKLKQALENDPKNQHGLWLLGISDYQAGDFSTAAETWRRLKSLLAPDSDVARAIDEQIKLADARASGKTQAQAEQMLQNAGSAPTTRQSG